VDRLKTKAEFRHLEKRMRKHRLLVERLNLLQAKAASETRRLIDEMDGAATCTQLQALPRVENANRNAPAEDEQMPAADLNTDAAGVQTSAEASETPGQGLQSRGGVDSPSAVTFSAADAGRLERFRNLVAYVRDWTQTGRSEQKPPEGDWRVWLLMGGRGSGKTRAGAEWVQGLAAGKTARPGLRIALVAETLGDAREVMIDGVSGICRIARNNRPDFEASRRRLVWPNGTVAQIFSSEDPESLRGPQFDYAWCDELGKWKHGQETWDMLQFALRLGDHPRAMVTTTPRPVPVLKALITDPGTTTCRIRTGDNAANLAPGFLSAMAGRYGGTRLGRQELDGELIEDREDALWTRAGIEALKLRDTGPLGRIVVAVDPPAGMGRESCCGIIVAGLDRAGRGVVLADCSVEGASPAGWAGAVVRAFRRFDADRIVAEVNQGGDMVSAVLRGIDAQLPVTSVRASRGKWMRAEPVAALYEQGRVVHAGSFPALEDQMCDFAPDGLSSGRSPDRLDALVWALTALMLDGGGEPRVRGI